MKQAERLEFGVGGKECGGARSLVEPGLWSGKECGKVEQGLWCGKKFYGARSVVGQGVLWCKEYGGARCVVGQGVIW